MRIEKCWVCSCNVYPGHGSLFVRNDCKMFRFCSGKCNSHFKMKHNPKKLKWTKASRRQRGKEMTMDKTLEMELRRNTPVRYNRNLWIKTVQAMKRIQELRQVRKARFHKRRLAAQVRGKESAAQKELTKHADLVKSIHVVKPREKSLQKLASKKQKERAKEKVHQMEE